MARGAARIALRSAVRDALAALPRLAGVPDRGILSARPDVSQLPERMVVTPQDRYQPATVGGVMDSAPQLMIVIRRSGASAQDDLDLDQDAIEPAVIAAVEIGSTTCELTEARFDFDGEGMVPIAQLTLTFSVQVYD